LALALVAIGPHAIARAAETVVVVHTVPLKVDEATVLSGAEIRLSLGGETRIIPRDRLQDVVVELTFVPGGPADTMEPERIGEFITNSLKDGSINHAGRALPFYLASARLDVLAARDALEEWSGLPGAVEALKMALLAIRADGEAFSEFRKRPELVAVLLFSIGLKEGTWLRSNGFRWVFTFSESFRGYVIERLERAVLEDDQPLIQLIPVVVRDSLGDEDPFYLNIRLLCERVLQVMNFKASDPVAGLYPLVEAGRRDPETQRILYPLLSQTLHRIAEEYLTQGRHAESLMVIARTDVSKRTARTHRILLEGLAGAKPDSVELARDQAVETMLSTVALRDAEVRTRYEEMLESHLAYAVANGLTSKGSLLLSRMLKIRADPDPANDDIRIQLALAELRQGNREGALGHLAGVRLGIPLMDRIRLGLAGLYVSRWVAFFCIVVPFIYVIWFAVVELRRLRGLRLRDEQARRSARAARVNQGQAGHGSAGADNYESKQSEIKFFTQGKINRPTDPRLIEYGQCLETLGVPPSASIRDIKGAYRSLVKHIHPDRLKENKGLASDRFIQLTQAYDRALELRKVLGLDGD
jgi:DnaJ-domain-containing protein 1